MSEFITGPNPVLEKLKAGNIKGRLYYSSENKAILPVLDLAQSSGINCIQLSRKELDKKVGHYFHKGCLLEILSQEKSDILTGPEKYQQLLKSEEALFLLLDGITDPHNLGAIMRSADKFQADLIILPKRRSCSVTETVQRSSAGASAWLPVYQVSNSARIIDECKKEGFWIYGADLDGVALDKTEFSKKVLLVLGSEGSGMGRLIKDKCDYIVTIPSAGHVDSLNVSVSAGIILYEIYRQKN